MICSRCGREANMTLRREGRSEWHCHACVDKLFPSIRPGSLALSFERPRAAGACPFCGTTVAQAKESGLVGCPLCYEALDPKLWAEFGLTPL